MHKIRDVLHPIVLIYRRLCIVLLQCCVVSFCLLAAIGFVRGVLSCAGLCDAMLYHTVPSCVVLYSDMVGSTWW